jgi:hypothetical protein
LNYHLFTYLRAITVQQGLELLFGCFKKKEGAGGSAAALLYVDRYISQCCFLMGI